MNSESLFDEMRELIIESLATYQPSKNNDSSEQAIFITSTSSTTRHPSENREITRASSTRAKSAARLNCSVDVFEHLQVKRAITKLQPLHQKWLHYRYGEAFSPELASDLIEITIEDLPLPNKNKNAKAKAKDLISMQVINLKELQRLQQKDLIEALGVSKRVFIRKYSPQAKAINNHLLTLDEQAISAFTIEFNVE